MKFAWSAVLALSFHLVAAPCVAAPAEDTVRPRYQPVTAGEVLQFGVVEGQIRNEFYRRGPVSAHMVLTSGEAPRLIVAFPAGNSGVELGFESTTQAVQWQEPRDVRGIRRTLDDGRVLYGLSAELTVHAGALKVRQAVLSSIRVVRDHVLLGEVPKRIVNQTRLDQRGVRWYRDRLDGKSAYELSIEVLAGRIENAGGDVRFIAPPDGGLRLRVSALTGDTPLTPIDMSDVVTGSAARDLRSRQVLAFLSYEEKLLAGSWRFLTYFGRDTLLSLRLLMPVLSVDTIEAGLSSVLIRLDGAGEVAHEEDIGEFAVLRALQEQRPASAEPVYDYKMIDDDYLLAPVLAEYLLHHPQGRARAAAFLRRPLGDGTYGEALVRNLRHVVSRTAAYVEDARPANLIALKPAVPVGQWRDSEEGLGRGRIPYDVNAVLAPAALQAVADLLASGLIDPYVGAQDRPRFAMAARSAERWRGAASHFEIRIDAQQARQLITSYSVELGVPAGAALAAVNEGGLDFPALALDARGEPVPVLHSDGGFAMLFGDPAPPALAKLVDAAMRPFPAGLLTPVGLLVANPVFADESLRRIFTAGHYHGTVVWSWQQALFAAGLERQLRRGDLPEPVRAQLRTAQSRLWQVIAATQETRTAELWSWRCADGVYRLAPFGQALGHKDESNAAQLWSTVYLAVRPPSQAQSASAR